MLDKIKAFFGIGYNVVKAEIEEFKVIEPTEDDIKQGEYAATLAVTAMSGMGYGCSASVQEAIAKAFSYVIRNGKDGFVDKDKLIVCRIINEIRERRNAEV